MKELNAFELQLDGINLIEASAGTGKTYNIQTIFLRLIVEKEIPIEKIMLLTFTNVAAAELKEKIREVLTKSLNPIDGEREGEVLKNLDKEKSCKLIRTALHNFDDNCISTIHGFCQKVLTEYAFESSVRFNLELKKDTNEIIKTLCKDYYRKIFYSENANLFVGLAKIYKIKDSNVFEIVDKFLSKPNLKTYPQISEYDIFNNISKAFNKVQKLYDENTLKKLAGYLKGAFKDDKILQDIEILNSKSINETYLETIRKYNVEKINSCIYAETSRNPEAMAELNQTLKDEFFEKINEFNNLLEIFAPCYYLSCQEFVKKRLDELKKIGNYQTFDDLIFSLLNSLNNKPLQNILQEKFSVGIIDEFQDTDPYQYAIFEKIFFERQDQLFFMVGDPKQAIYSFRGGDIVTYRKAMQAVESNKIFSLQTNYRSSEAMISGVNKFFSSSTTPPFGENSKIEFNEVGFSQKEEFKTCNIDDALQFIETYKTNLDEVLDAAVNEIIRILSDKTLKLPEHNHAGINPEDISILVRTKKSAQIIMDALQKRGVLAYFTKGSSIFKSNEAKEMFIFLDAVINHSNAKYLQRALITPICGKSVSDLIEMQEKNDINENNFYYMNFQELFDLWQKQSFYVMIRKAFEIFKSYENICKLKNCERKLTNYMRLADILQQFSQSEALQPIALVERLENLINDENYANNEEYEQPLPSEKAAIQITTIHSSKGLEYPIVILPDLDFEKKNISKGFEISRDENQNEIIDFTNSLHHKEFAKLERNEEKRRLIYVALTRAKYLTIVMLADLKEKKTSSELREIANVDLLKDNNLLFENSNCKENFTQKLIAPNNLEIAIFDENKIDNWKISSYSNITPNGNEDNLYDYDENDEDFAGEANNEILGFPGGAHTGNAWHKLFETIDYSSLVDKNYISLVLNTFGLLKNANLKEGRINTTERMLKNVLSCPFLNGGSLKDISFAQRINEFEFYFSFNKEFSLAKLKEILYSYVEEKLGKFVWGDSRQIFSGGFISGFIDLIFEKEGKYYIIDWKSNRLKGNIRNFEADSIKIVMRDDYYFLQYIIYSVALAKFLRQRIGSFTKEHYEKYFGGVYYLFLRGIDPKNTTQGIFFDRVPFEIIEKFEDLIK